MTLRYLLLDLDGTLLPMDTEEFLGAYFKLLSRKLSEYIIPTEFIQKLLASTEAMVHDLNPTRTNQDVFMDDFFGRTGLPQDEVRALFDHFYANDFCSLVSRTKPSCLAREIVEEASLLGLELIIATNPLFPMTAIQERMRWAGVENVPFRLVTAYENMHFCKPYPHYYKEILQHLGARPEECLMAGNDVDEDLVAKQVGIATFLVDDYIINRSDRTVDADYRGGLADLLAFIKQQSM